MKKWVPLLFIVLLSGSQCLASPFSRTKKLLPQVYSGHQITFYCGCGYSGKSPDLDSCGYVPRKNRKRASRIEWEHIVPAQAFGQSFREWRVGDPACVNSRGKRYKGRRCARKASKDFAKMEGDPVNLVPSVGEVNGDRSNYSYAEIPGEKRKYGNCDFEIEHRKAEPREKVRGDIARVYFYMDQKYPGRGIISRKNRKLFEAWNRLDPVSGWEKERNRRIFQVFGVYNSFVGEVR